MRRSILTAAVLALAVPTGFAAPAAAQDGAAQTALAPVLAHARRAEDRARDEHRHPAETLAFFRVQPGMTVVDYMPAGGWYSRVLVPYLGQSGTYIGLNPELDDSLTGYWDMYRDTAEKLPAQAQEWTGGEGARVIGANTNDVPEELHGTADRFLIFREVHNMRRFGWLHDSLVMARNLLKDDGLLGVVQHRAKADAPAGYVLGDNGYQREQDVIGLMQAFGFELVERSEINANPKDPANWEGGVWTLPPGYRGAGEDAARRAELDAIGESDRMTLLFRKRP
jgi:predicted methyltransferase